MEGKRGKWGMMRRKLNEKKEKEVWQECKESYEGEEKEREQGD